MIMEVYRFLHDDRVMCFDEKGRQLIQYQGKFCDVADAILRDAHASTQFYTARYGEEERKVRRTVWAKREPV